MPGASDPISEVIGDVAYQQVQRLQDMLDKLADTLVTISQAASKVGNTSGGSTLGAFVAEQQALNKTNVEGAKALADYTERARSMNSVVEQGIAFKQSFNGASRETVNVILQLARVQTEQSKQALNNSKVETEQLKQKLIQIKLNADEEKKAAVVSAEAAKLRKQADQEEAELLRLINAEQKARATSEDAELARMIEKEAAIKRQVALWNQLLAAEDAAQTAGGTSIVSRDSLNRVPVATTPVDRYAISSVTDDERAALQAKAAALESTTAATNQQSAASRTLIEYTAAEVALLKDQGIVLREGTYILKENAAAQNAEVVSEVQALSVKEQTILRAGQIKAELALVAQQLRQNAVAFQAGSIGEEAYNAETLRLTTSQFALAAEAKTVNTALIEQGVIAESSSSRFGSAFGKLLGPVRQLAYILPGIGIAGLFNLAWEGIQKLVSGLSGVEIITKKAQKAMDDYKKSLQNIDDGANVTAGQQVAKLQVLNSVVTDLTASEKKRKEAAQEMIKLAPTILGNYTQEAILAGKAAGAIDKITEAILANAAAKALEEKYGAATVNVINQRKAEKAALDEVNKAQAKYDTAKKAGNSFADIEYGASGEADAAEAALARAKYNYGKIQKLREDSEKEQKGYLNDAKEAIKGADDLLTKPKKTPGTKSFTNANESLDRNIDKEIGEQDRLQIQANADKNLAIVSDDKRAYDERIAALSAFIIDEEKLNKSALTTAKSINQDELADIDKKESAARKAGILTAAMQENLDKQRTLSNQKFRTAQTQFDKAEIDARVRNANLLTEINDQEQERNLKAAIEGSKRIQEQMQDGYDQEIAALNAKHAAGTISEKAYQEQRLKITREYSAKIIQAQIDNFKELLSSGALGKEGDEAYKKTEDLIESLRAKLTSLQSSKPRKGVLGFSDEDLKLLSEITTETETYAQALGNINKLFDEASQKRLQGYQAELDAIEKNKQADTDAINASIGNADEKAKAIAVINGRAAAEEQKINEKMREEKRKQAQRDKAIALAEIVIKTALAVVNQLGSGDPYSAIPRAVAVGILGATELAVAAAQPIPEYAEGEDDHPGGLAIVGDGGRNEIVKKPDGKILLTPAVPTLLDLPEHSIVYKSVEDYIREAQGMTMRGMGMLRHVDERPSAALEVAMDRQTAAIVDAVRSMPQAESHMSITGDGVVMLVKNGQSQIQYINQVLHRK